MSSWCPPSGLEKGALGSIVSSRCLSQDGVGSTGELRSSLRPIPCWGAEGSVSLPGALSRVGAGSTEEHWGPSRCPGPEGMGQAQGPAVSQGSVPLRRGAAWQDRTGRRAVRGAER